MISHTIQRLIAPVCRAALAFVPLLALTGCYSSTTTVAPNAEPLFSGERTYAWVAKPPMGAASQEEVGPPAAQEEVAAAFRRALDGELKAAGFRKVSAGEARFAAGLYLGVKKDMRTADPLFTVYPVERIERGHAVLTFALSETEEVAWTTKTSLVIRVTERGMGQGELSWVGTEEIRDWRIGRTVGRLTSDLP